MKPMVNRRPREECHTGYYQFNEEKVNSPIMGERFQYKVNEELLIGY